MSGKPIDRRDFISKASVITAATTAFSFEEQSLLAYQRRQPASAGADVTGPMPMGKLGNLNVSRLIAGHNLVGATAHARDLIYVSQLLRAYFTDEKILDTYRKYEEAGINTAFLRVEARQLMLAKKYRDECGGKLQWMAQLVVNEKDLTHDLDLAMETGANAAYIRGLEGDRFFKAGKLDLIAKAVEKVKACKIPAGIGSHLLDTLIAVEKEGIPADFYFKTFNSAQYWSAGPALQPDPHWKPGKEELVQSEYAPGNHDNLWETTPAQTKAFFEKVEKPFIAYKVLAAGAIHPRDGFEYAFANGADFISVGMYDFQIAEDVNITKEIFEKKPARTRPWRV